MQNREMGLSFFRIPRSQNTPAGMERLKISQKPSNWTLQLENMKSL